MFLSVLRPIPVYPFILHTFVEPEQERMGTDGNVKTQNVTVL